MKLITILIASALGVAVPQEQEGEDQMTPAQAMELLEDAERMMKEAERLLNDSSRGKAIETEKKLRDQLERELGPDQKGILEKVEKLVEKAEKKEKDAAKKLDEVIKKARSSSGRSRQGQQPKPQEQQKSKPNQSQNPAKDTYNPNRADEPSKFKSAATESGAWGNLPPAVRAAMRDASREEVPPEFQELWMKYFESLEKAGK